MIAEVCVCMYVCTPLTAVTEGSLQVQLTVLGNEAGVVRRIELDVTGRDGDGDGNGNGNGNGDDNGNDNGDDIWQLRRRLWGGRLGKCEGEREYMMQQTQEQSTSRSQGQRKGRHPEQSRDAISQWRYAISSPFRLQTHTVGGF